MLAAAASFVVLLLGFAGRLHPLFDSIGHFRVQETLVVFALAICMTVLRRWKSFAAMLLLIVFSTYSMLYPAGFELTTLHVGPVFRLVQFNSLFKNPTPQKSADWIRAQSPDVVTIQEVSRNTEAILMALKPDLPHQILCSYAAVGGVAILSRHPITASHCKQGEGLVWARVKVGNSELTVVSVHLHWPYPFKQQAHITRLLPDFADMPRPIVVAGDFNAAPWGEGVRRISEATQTRVVDGLRLTLKMGPPPLGPIPFIPIDHVLLPNGWTLARKAEVGPSIGSDHLPVTADFQLPGF